MKIVFLDHFTLNSDGLDIGPLDRLGDVAIYPRTHAEDVLDRCKGAEVIITNKVKIEKAHFQVLKNLRLIVVAATGYNNIDIEAARNSGVIVSNVRGYSTESVVQHTFSLILGILNKVETYGKKVKGGEWQQIDDFTFYEHSIHELSGKIMGIIGYGTIGQRVAQVASAFRMDVQAYRRHPVTNPRSPHKMVSLDTIFSNADIISCHAPLNEDSFHVINKQSIARMKPSCIIINTARGGLINEHDLATALMEGRISAAGIDTLIEEPPKDNPLLQAPRCIITPHQAWTSYESRLNLLNGIIDNIRAYQQGEPLNVVNL